MPKLNLSDDEPQTGVETNNSPAVSTQRRFNPADMAVEAARQFSAIESEVTEELKPKSYIERMHAKDWAFGQWEKERYRGFSNSLVRKNMRPALENVLRQLLATTESFEVAIHHAKKLFAGWLRNNEADLIRIEEIFTEFNLDERTIEAEAWRLTSADTALLQRMQTFAVGLQDKAFSNFVNYRDYLAAQPQKIGPPIMEADEAPLDKLRRAFS